LFSLRWYFFFTEAVFAQADSTPPKKMLGPMATTSKDHFMIQLGGAYWQNKPDSITTTGFSRTFNMYLMLDFPFHTNQHGPLFFINSISLI
jgi:hypothetical protein